MSRAPRRSLIRRIARLGLLASGGGAAYLWWERSHGGPPLDLGQRGFPEGSESIVVTEDGAQLAVCTAGPDGAPTVVLCHCWMGSRAVWGPVAARLVEQGLRVVLYDQRGHGASTAGSRAPSIPVLGDDLRAVLDAAGGGDAVLAGHSMGGMTIQSYATEHPVDFKERVRGVVLVSTTTKVTGRTPSPRAIERSMGERANAMLWRGALGYVLVRRSLGRAPRRADIELTLHGIAHTSVPIRSGFLTAFADLDLAATLPQMQVPASVLVGARDGLTPPAAARVLAAGLPDATLEVLPHAGHMLPLERPDEVADVIQRIRVSALA